MDEEPDLMKNERHERRAAEDASLDPPARLVAGTRFDPDEIPARVDVAKDKHDG